MATAHKTSTHMIFSTCVTEKKMLEEEEDDAHICTHFNTGVLFSSGQRFPGHLSLVFRTVNRVAEFQLAFKC